MENTINTYLNLNPTFKQFYIKNNDLIIDENIDPEPLFFNVYHDVDIILSCLNISPSKCGYGYWIDAVYIFLLSNKNRISICKDVYPAIAQKYNTTAMAVERAMRLCFENVMYYTSKHEDNFICAYFKNLVMYPHNSEILVKLVDLMSSKKFQSNKSKHSV